MTEEQKEIVMLRLKVKELERVLHDLHKIASNMHSAVMSVRVQGDIYDCDEAVNDISMCIEENEDV